MGNDKDIMLFSSDYKYKTREVLIHVENFKTCWKKLFFDYNWKVLEVPKVLKVQKNMKFWCEVKSKLTKTQAWNKKSSFVFLIFVLFITFITRFLPNPYFTVNIKLNSNERNLKFVTN